jgi:hypothetical protein
MGGLHGAIQEKGVPGRYLQRTGTSKNGSCFSGLASKKKRRPGKTGTPEKHFMQKGLRFLRGAAEKRGHVEIIRSRRIFLVNDFVDGGTRRFL